MECQTIVIKNRKIVWKRGPYCGYSCLNFKIIAVIARNFQNKSVSSSFKWILNEYYWVSMNILFLVKLKVGRRSFFGRNKECKVRLHSRVLSCYEGLKKALLLRNLKLFLHSLLDPLTKKYSRVWSSMINFVDKVQYMSEESSCQQEEPLTINYSFQGKMCQEYYAVLLTMSLLESSSNGIVP